MKPWANGILEAIAVLVVLSFALREVVLERRWKQEDEATDKDIKPDEGSAFVDVRKPDEFASGHIPGAINIPLESIGSVSPAGLPDLDQLIYVYCKSGLRSAGAKRALARLGYANVVDFGSIDNWKGELEQA